MSEDSLEIVSLIHRLYEWPGYDFWGLALALFGFGGTVFLSWRASKNAKIAASAARAAKHSMQLADAVNQLGMVQQFIVEIRLRVEGRQWEQVSEKCQTVREIVSPMLRFPAVEFSDETTKLLVGLQAQMSTLQRNSDQTRHEEAEFDFVKTSTVLAKQAEAVAVATREVKEKTNVIPNH